MYVVQNRKEKKKLIIKYIYVSKKGKNRMKKRTSILQIYIRNSEGKEKAVVWWSLTVPE